MYCPNCAAPYTHGLKFCKQCGTHLGESPQTSTLAQPAPAPKVTGAAWGLALATVAIVLGGLGIVFSHAYDLVRPAFPGETRSGDATPVAIVMLVFGSLVVFGVVALLVRLFGHLIAPHPHTHATPAHRDKSVIGAPPPVQLHAPPSSVGSVTEHTTRNFEPGVYDKYHARE